MTDVVNDIAVDGIWLNSQVGESESVWINDLVQELSLNLIRRDGWPPDGLVEDVGNWLEDGLWHVDVASLLHDFLLNQLLDLSHGKLFWAVELKGLAMSPVVVHDDLQSTGDIDDVNWVELLLHVVGLKDVGVAGESVEETILETVHWGWSDNGGLWEDFAGSDFSLSLDKLDTGSGTSDLHPYLGAVVLGGRVQAGIVARDLNESVNIVFGNGLGDSLGSLNVNISVGEVPIKSSTPNPCGIQFAIIHTLLGSLFQ